LIIHLKLFISKNRFLFIYNSTSLLSINICLILWDCYCSCFRNFLHIFLTNCNRLHNCYILFTSGSHEYKSTLSSVLLNLGHHSSNISGFLLILIIRLSFLNKFYTLFGYISIVILYFWYSLPFRLILSLVIYLFIWISFLCKLYFI